MKKLSVVVISLLLSLEFMMIGKIESASAKTNELQSNQLELLYIYSDKDGYCFLDPESELGDIIFVGSNYYKVDSNFKIDKKSLYYGKKFIGTFADSSKWELTSIKEKYKTKKDGK